uniref:Lysine-specific demethylase JMJ25 n=1 Tax=Kalanchoe fedtschenkoi TaxID=63787 RepID=A0A7N0U5X4_KALFE
MMDNNYSTSGNGEDGIGIPDDLRCKRSDGKQWRCTAMSMPDKTVCEKHYIQAKKRAANSAQRASLKKGKRKKVVDSEYVDSRNDDMDTPNEDETLEEYAVSPQRKKLKGKVPKREFSYSPESSPERSFREREDNEAEFLKSADNQRSSYGDLPLAAMDVSTYKSKNTNDSDETEEYSDGSTDSSDETDEQPCHQCQRNDKILWCLRCDRRGYCGSCISTWYSDTPAEEIQKACPACRGSCVCEVCRRTERLIKARIRQVHAQEKLEYLYNLLSSVLPIIKKIHHQQTIEVDLEIRLHGTDVNLTWAKLSADEQMCCNFCRTPIIDYYRDCENCSYDLCLYCCKELREASVMKGQDKEGMAESPLKNNIFIGKFHKWKANRDGSIPCPLRECVGCPSLVLCRTFKMNWVAKLVKNAEEIVTGCKVTDVDDLDNNEPDEPGFFKAATREDSDDNFLYSPTFEDTKIAGINIFRKYWLKGQPIVVKQICNNYISSWDPVNICRGILEMTNEKIDDGMQVKAIDCWDRSEVKIELDQFIKGYSEGMIQENGKPQVLKWTVCMAPSIFEEFLSYQNLEIINKLPFLEYVHPKWGLLNVAAKLPQYSLQNDAGFKIIVSYGPSDELVEGDCLTKVSFSMNDKVFMLVHSKVKQNGLVEEDLKFSKTENDAEALQTTLIKQCPPALPYDGQPEKSMMDANKEDNRDNTIREQQTSACNGDAVNNNPELPDTCNGDLEKTDARVIWDIFRRQDVPKLREFFKMQFDDAEDLDHVNHLYEEDVYLNEHHKRLLKEQFGVEPWSFEQRTGQAVFIPAGCPFQLTNLQSTVQLSLDFLSPESLGEAAKMAEEIRCLPDDHHAKLKMLEVGKISLYAASSAIKDIQKLVLDPKFSSDIGPEDLNLTKMVSENLENMTRRRQRVACS